MQAETTNYRDFEDGQQSEQDKGLLVRFFMRTNPATEKSMPYVDIKTPGNRGGGYCGPARKDHIKRFPEHYKAFENRMDMPDEGTPVTKWPLISEERAEQLTFQHIKTVEQLALVPDGNLTSLMGGNALKARAIKWLEDNAKVKQAEALKSELEARDKRIEELEARLDRISDDRVTSVPKNGKK